MDEVQRILSFNILMSYLVITTGLQPNSLRLANCTFCLGYHCSSACDSAKTQIYIKYIKLYHAYASCISRFIVQRDGAAGDVRGCANTDHGWQNSFPT